MSLFGRAASKADFYQTHLERVSRSFAFCIAELRSPLRDWVALSYLLCRLADTIEDSRWKAKADQDRAYVDFAKLVESSSTRADVEKFRGELDCEMPPGERTLVADAALLIEDLHALPQPPREIIQQTVLNMVRGMRHFSREHTDERGLALGSTAELNQYCFFVAGVIGELLTGVAGIVDPALTVTDDLVEASFHFGLFLQKINVLKDQRGDEQEGRRLVAARTEIERDLLAHARRGFDYVLAIPPGLADFRLFCAWSLFLGLISIPWIQRSHREGKALKISRLETFAFLNRVRGAVRDDARLKMIFDEQIEKLVAADAALASSTPSLTERAAPPAWFHEAYSGRLSPSGLATLRLFPETSR